MKGVRSISLLAFFFQHHCLHFLLPTLDNILSYINIIHSLFSKLTSIFLSIHEHVLHVQDEPDFSPVRQHMTVNRDAELEYVKNARHALLLGTQAKKKGRTGLVKTWNKRFLWLSEDLLFFRWCRGDAKNWKLSENDQSHIEVANIGRVSKASNSSASSQFTLTLIDAPDSPLSFDVGKNNAASWIENITRLCKGELAYQLSWDERDEGCQIAIHWRAEDNWFPGQFLYFN
jgi:hypothetical protein